MSLTNRNPVNPGIPQKPIFPSTSLIMNADWFKEDNHDIEVAHRVLSRTSVVKIPEVPSDQSSSSVVIHTIVHPDHQVSKHNSKWTKDHPLENIIGALDRPVPQRHQLHEQALLSWLLCRGYRQDEGRECSEDIRGVARVANALHVRGYDTMSSFLITNELLQSSVDPTLFIRREGTNSFCGYFHGRESQTDEDREGKAVDPSNGILLALTAFAIVESAALGRERIEFLINKLEMRSFTPETLKQLADDVDE
ncbi:hypothetical protein Tco_0786170 [Tanacetum coccineum]